MFRGLATGIFGIAFLAAAMAQPIDVSSLEALALRTNQFVGKRVTISGWMTSADETSGSVSFDAGRLREKSMLFRWPKKEGDLYERSLLTCGKWKRVDTCKIEISGVVTASLDIADHIFLDQIEVKWVK